VDLVVSDNHRLFILDGDLETQYSTAFAGPVHDVRALPAEGNDAKRLLVVHDGVSTLLYGSEPRGSVELWVRPAGSRVQLGERSVSGGRAPVFTGLQPGSYRVKVRTPDGVAYEEELEVRGGRLTSAWVGRPPVAPEDRLRMDRFPPGRVKDAAPPPAILVEFNAPVFS
jgi:hypothetical protein